MTSSINSKTAHDIRVFSSLSQNLTLTMDQFPSLGVELHSEAATWSGSGFAFNVATTIARLGGRAVIISILGKDLIGDMLIEQLKNMNSVVHYIVRREGIQSPLTMSIYDNFSKENQAAGVQIENNAYSNLQPFDVCIDPIKSSRVIIIDLVSISVSVEIATNTHKHKIPMAFTLHEAWKRLSDPVYEKGIREIYQFADYCFSNEENFINWRRKDDLTAAIKDALDEHPGIILVVTRGDKGSVIATSFDEMQIPRFQVKQGNDKGNDDSYYGAFLYAHRGLGWNLQHSKVLATAVSALSGRRINNRPNLPNLYTAISAIKKAVMEIDEI
jgi:sugar/nucleoside kinase (ribokinase family)